MKRFLILLIVACSLLCLALSACSSNKTAPTEDGVLTEIHDDNGTVTGYERRYHNDNGDITRLDVYDAKQAYQSFVIYDYYSDGRLYTETHYRADGIAVSRDVYSYDDTGALSEIAHESPYGDVVVDRYDANGNVIEKDYFDTDGKLERREVLEADSWVSYNIDGTTPDTE